ncbi:MAG TPA: SDR family oxidoreductase [Bacillales bacterium]|nr:SDR family oxidoreductase [Bacillales bacterium]
MILITGATGNVGREIVKKLHKSGHKVRALSRNPEKAELPPGVEVVAGDLSHPETLKNALDRIQKVFMIHVPGSDRFPEVAKQSGVRHIVFLSSSAIESKTDNAIGRFHLETEKLIRQSGVSWTFLRPGAFMTNTLQWASSIRSEMAVREPFGDVGTAPIDPRDIAAVATDVLVSSGHEGKIYTLTGPEVLTPEEQVRILSEVLGESIEFKNIPETAAQENMKNFAPEEIVEALFQLKREAVNRPPKALRTVEEVTGHPARTYRQWVTSHADAFQSTESKEWA